MPLDKDDGRGTSNRGTGREQALDERLAEYAKLSSVATVLNMGSLTGDEIAPVLNHVAAQVRRFESAPGPLTARVVADDLLEALRVLRDRERVAPRENGALMKTVRRSGMPALLLPWARARPARLEDVTAEDGTRPLFGSADVARWMTAVSYRPPPAAGSARRRASPAPWEPLDSTSVEAFALVLGKGADLRRREMPWPFPPLIVHNSYRIAFIKGPGMSFLTREGRIEVLAYILEQVAELNDAGEAYSSDKEVSLPPRELAAFIVSNAAIAYGTLLFQGPDSAFLAFEHAPVSYVTDFIVTDAMLDILHYSTDIKKKYRWKDEEPRAKGCGSIEWLTELFKDVPHYRKEMWIQDKVMSDKARVVYPGNYRAGDTVPAQLFLPKKTAESLGDKDHMVVFVGSFTANDRIIKTEDGRLWLVKEYERDLAGFCHAVVQLQGILTFSFIVASALGAVLGGPLVGFCLTAGDIAIEINEAGGIRSFLKELKDHPFKAAWFMFDLLMLRADAKAMKKLWMNPRAVLEEVVEHATQAAKGGHMPPSAGGQAVTQGAAVEQRLLGDTSAAGKEAHSAQDARAIAGKKTEAAEAAAPKMAAEAKAGATAGEAKAAERPPSGRPTQESRAAKRPTEPSPPKTEPARPRPKGPPEKEVELAGGGAKKKPPAEKPPKPTKVPKERPKPKPRKVPKEPGRPPKRPPKKKPPARRGEPNTPLRGGARTGARAAKPPAAAKGSVSWLVGEDAAARSAADRLEKLGGRELTESIAETYGELSRSRQAKRLLKQARATGGEVRNLTMADHGRNLLKEVASLADQEIRGLAKVQRALEEAGSGVRNWYDVFLDLRQFPRTRSDLLRLVDRVEPLVKEGFAEALARTLQGGPHSLTGGLGHLHAIEHLAEKYRGFGVVFRIEERSKIRKYARRGSKIVEDEQRAVREVDIVAILNDGRQIDHEVKTYTNAIEITDSFRNQIAKDLLGHLEGIPKGAEDLSRLWADLRYMFPEGVAGQLEDVREAIVRAFKNHKVSRALDALEIDRDLARRILEERLKDTANPMVDVFAFKTFE